MDANAKLDSNLHKMTENGRFMLGMVQRQNLVILNNLAVCTGQITRQRITREREEKAILDYILTCEQLANHVEKMLIDEERLFTLTKYVSTKGIRRKCVSDHNPLFCSFNLSYQEQSIQLKRKEIFNFKNKEGQVLFKNETEETTKFTDVFENKDTFEKQTQKFQRCLKQSVQKNFPKLRVRKAEKKSEVGCLLEEKSKLTIFLKTNQCKISLNDAQEKLNKIENKIQEISSDKNVKIVEDYIQSMKVGDKFNQLGMWQLKKKLHPSKQMDPLWPKKTRKVT